MSNCFYLQMILSEACPLLAPALFKIQLPDYKDVTSNFSIV